MVATLASVTLIVVLMGTLLRKGEDVATTESGEVRQDHVAVTSQPPSATSLQNPFSPRSSSDSTAPAERYESSASNPQAYEPPIVAPSESRATSTPHAHGVTRPDLEASLNLEALEQEPSSHESFPLSDSVKSGCSNTPDLCAREYELLTKMAEERRDPAWASAMEEKLRHWIEVEPDRYAIRALECRQTVCAVEVASIMGRFPGPTYQEQRGSKLSDEAGYFGYERNEYGATVTVTLRIFERW
jgi:hypothetical protein